MIYAFTSEWPPSWRAVIVFLLSAFLVPTPLPGK